MLEMQALNNLKYTELRKLAKDAGIKANMKSEKLIKALEEHYHKNVTSQAQPETNSTSDASVDNSSDKDESGCDMMEGTAQPGSASPVAEAKPGKPRTTKQAKRRGRKGAKNQKSDCSDTKTVRVERGKRKMSDSPPEDKNEEEENSIEVQPSKKRRGTFEVVPSPQVTDKPESVGEVAVNKRDSAGEVTLNKRDSVGEVTLNKRDSVGEVMEAMKPEMNSMDMKESLLAAIEKKVEKKMVDEGAVVESTSTSRIPRFAAFLAKRKAEKAVVTPGNKNWTKIHEKNFAKMDSIDVYLAKKRKRNLSITNSLQRAKESASRTREALAKLSNHRTPDPKKRKKDGLPLPFKSPVGKVTPFKPSVTSTKSISFKFGNSTKTPVFAGNQKSTHFRRSPRNTENTNVENKKVSEKAITDRKSLGELNSTLQPQRRKSCVTPFKPLNTTLDVQSTKKAFDLQASLSKPLSWKPYTGKLKPLEPKISSHQNPNLKNSSIKVAPQKNSRAKRLAEAKGRQADKKFNEQMKRRGIVA